MNPARLPSSLGVRRRELLQVGSSALLGLSLPGLLGKQPVAAAAQKAGLTGRAKSVILAFQTGACSHHDTFDMKPDASAEARGPFQPIATPVPGFQVCEHLPRLAERAKKYAVVRSFSHRDNNHLMSTHHVLTGHLQPGGFFDKVASRTDWPCYAAACDHLKPPQDAIPSGVHLPTFLMSAPLTWPGPVSYTHLDVYKRQAHDHVVKDQRNQVATGMFPFVARSHVGRIGRGGHVGKRAVGGRRGAQRWDGHRGILAGEAARHEMNRPPRASASLRFTQNKRASPGSGRLNRPLPRLNSKFGIRGT